jgi:7-cyano-7-deazaguanine synthase
MTLIQKRALVLYGGGIDSSTVLAFLHEQDYKLGALWVDYGQVAAEQEKLSCLSFCQPRGIELHTIKIDIDLGAKSAIMNRDAKKDDRKSNVLDGRNAILLSLAASVAVAHDYSTIAVGFHYEPDKTFPDSRPEFFQAFRSLLDVGMVQPVSLVAPFQRLERSEIFALADSIDSLILDVAHTCYADVPFGCGVCSHCLQKASYVRIVPDNETLDRIRARIDPALFASSGA